MAGRRRRDGKPLVRTQKAERRMAAVNGRLAEAANQRDRVAIAADYLRGALALHPNDDVAEQVVLYLVTTANRIYRQQQKGGGNGGQR